MKMKKRMKTFSTRLNGRHLMAFVLPIPTSDLYPSWILPTSTSRISSTMKAPGKPRLTAIRLPIWRLPKRFFLLINTARYPSRPKFKTFSMRPMRLCKAIPCPAGHFISAWNTFIDWIGVGLLLHWSSKTRNPQLATCGVYDGTPFRGISKPCLLCKDALLENNRIDRWLTGRMIHVPEE